MNKNTKLIVYSIAKSMLFWISIILFWLLKEKATPSSDIFLFFAPYYFLWFMLMVVCILKTGRAMKVLWIGNLRDSETLSEANLPYALSFIIGCLIITYVEYKYIWW